MPYHHPERAWPSLASHPAELEIAPITDYDFADPCIRRISWKKEWRPGQFGPDGPCQDFYLALATQTPNPVQDRRGNVLLDVGADQTHCDLPAIWSYDLQHWSRPRSVTVAHSPFTRGTQNTWAPELIYHPRRQEYVLWYARQLRGDQLADQFGMGVFVATARQPFGPYQGEQLLVGGQAGFADIDPSYFCDPETGKHFLYLGSACEPLRVVELDDSLTRLIGEPMPVCWPQADQAYRNLLEALNVFYCPDAPKSARYGAHLSGSGCFYPDGYALLYAMASSPYGPFTLHDQPLIDTQSHPQYMNVGHDGLLAEEAGDVWGLPGMTAGLLHFIERASWDDYPANWKPRPSAGLVVPHDRETGLPLVLNPTRARQFALPATLS